MATPLQRLQAIQDKPRAIFGSDTTSCGIRSAQSDLASRNIEMDEQLLAIKRANEQQLPNRPQVSGMENLPLNLESFEGGEQSGIIPGKARVTQVFGNYNPGVEKFSGGRNLGVDFAVKKGTPLALPPGQWEVISTFGKAVEGNRSANKGSGNLVKVRNSQTGEMLTFEHLDSVGVNMGQMINGGTVIGRSGNTGNSTGPHASIPYQDASGKYLDILKSRYGKYIFGGGPNGSGNGSGGGFADVWSGIKENATSALNRADYTKDLVSTLGENAMKGLSKNLLYNLETKRAFPRSLYWDAKDIDNIDDPKLRQEAFNRLALDTSIEMMGGVQAKPGISRGLINKIDDVGLKWESKAKELEPLTELNPTGSVFVDYTPGARAKAPLGQNITTLAKTQGESPDTMVTIYRGVSDKGRKINPGDFITDNYNIAKSYGDHIISKRVKLGDILDDIEGGNGVGEYLYRPGATAELKNVKYDITKSEWYKNYIKFLAKDPDRFPTLNSWLDGMKVSGKPKSQLTKIYNQVNK